MTMTRDEVLQNKYNLEGADLQGMDLGIEGCSFDGPAERLTLVEYIPEDLRASHAKAGNRGVYPYNGAIRARVCPECLRDLFLYNEGWVKLV